MVNFLRNCQTIFQISCTILCSHWQMSEDFNVFTLSITVASVYLFDYSHLSGYEVVSHCDSNLHFLVD